MRPTPPLGSVLALETTGDGSLRIAWPAPSRGAGRWGAAGFIAFWLCAWLAGEVFAGKALAGMLFGGNGMAGPQGFAWFPVLFLGGWLGGWTVGGVFAATALYNLVGKPRPGSVTLGVDGLVIVPESRFEPGSPRGRPRVCTIRRDELGPIRLERVGERQRLTVDVGADRIEIGAPLREPEREWLADVLREWAGRPS